VVWVELCDADSEAAAPRARVALRDRRDVDTERPTDLDHLSVIQSAPLAPADLNGWLVQVLTTAAINAPLTVTASALCIVQE
jgi:hypothetical protein